MRRVWHGSSPSYSLTVLGRRALPRERKVIAIPPLAPRAVVADEPRVAEQAQHEIGVRGAMMGLAVGDDGLVGRHRLRDVDRAELVRRLEGAVGAKVLLPVDVDMPRLRTRCAEASPRHPRPCLVL